MSKLKYNGIFTEFLTKGYKVDIVSVNNLKFGYDKNIVLDNVNISIEKGDFVCFLGKSGCGKSTLLRLISGLSKPNKGEILINGKLHKGPSLNIGMVFQDYSLFPWMTTGDNIVMAMEQKFKNIPRNELKEKAKKFIENVGLERNVFDKYPNELSGGMKQRCAICRAFVLNPEILLMDEPFGALDAITRNLLQNLTLELWKEEDKNRKTIVFVTHDVDEAIKLSTKIFLFGANKGEIIFSYCTSSGNQLENEDDKTDLRNKLLDYMNYNVESYS